MYVKRVDVYVYVYVYVYVNVYVYVYVYVYVQFATCKLASILVQFSLVYTNLFQFDCETSNVLLM